MVSSSLEQETKPSSRREEDSTETRSREEGESIPPPSLFLPACLPPSLDD